MNKLNKSIYQLINKKIHRYYSHFKKIPALFQYFQKEDHQVLLSSSVLETLPENKQNKFQMFSFCSRLLFDGVKKIQKLFKPKKGAKTPKTHSYFKTYCSFEKENHHYEKITPPISWSFDVPLTNKDDLKEEKRSTSTKSSSKEPHYIEMRGFSQSSSIQTSDFQSAHYQIPRSPVAVQQDYEVPNLLCSAIEESYYDEVLDLPKAAREQSYGAPVLNSENLFGDPVYKNLPFVCDPGASFARKKTPELFPFKNSVGKKLEHLGSNRRESRRRASV